MTLETVATAFIGRVEESPAAWRQFVSRRTDPCPLVKGEAFDATPVLATFD